VTQLGPPTILHEHEGELHKEEIDYITNFTFTESYFYGLPKVHKSEVISNAILVQHTECIKILNPDDLKFRPIVGGPNCVTQRLSHFIDSYSKVFRIKYVQGIQEQE
jgi:hypothetical protein